MNIAQLIERLKDFPEDAEVWADCGDPFESFQVDNVASYKTKPGVLEKVWLEA